MVDKETFSNKTYMNFDMDEEEKDEILKDNKSLKSIPAWKKAAVVLTCVATVIVVIIVTAVVILKFRSDHVLDLRSHPDAEFYSNYSFNVSEDKWLQLLTANTECHINLTKLQFNEQNIQRENTEMQNNLSALQINEHTLKQKLLETQIKNEEIQENVTKLQNNEYALGRELQNIRTDYLELQNNLSTLQSNGNSLEKELLAVQIENLELKNNLSTLQSDGHILKQQIKELQNENSELQSNVSSLQSNEQNLQEKLQNIKNENSNLQQNLSILANTCQEVTTDPRSNAKCAFSALQSKDFETVVDPRLPFNQTIRTNGIGKRVFIGGIVHVAEARIGLNFVRGNDDIAFHCDFRQNHMGDVRRIVANSRANGVWGKEERTYKWPIVRHKSFCIEFSRKTAAFEVKFDGEHLFDFNYRSHSGNIGDYIYLQIAGDIILEEVSFTVE